MSNKNVPAQLNYFSPKKPVPSDSPAHSVPIGRIFYSKERKLHFEALAASYKKDKKKGQTTSNS